MDAIKNELRRACRQRAGCTRSREQETLDGLNNWLRRNPDAPYYDRLVGQSLADELSVVLRGGG